MSRGIFVTGTDTGVGKTVISRALARSAVRRGIAVAAVKPVESGVEDVRHTDAVLLAEAAQRREEMRDVNVFSFRAPVSPHLAARLENREIDPDRLAAFLRGWTARAELVIAEGAGGLMVPLSTGITYAEVIAQSGFELIVVAPNRLGAVNMTLLTVEAARRRNISVLGVVLNGTPACELGNAEAVAAWGRIPILGEFPAANCDDDECLADAAQATLDLSLIFGTL